MGADIEHLPATPDHERCLRVPSALALGNRQQVDEHLRVLRSVEKFGFGEIAVSFAVSGCDRCDVEFDMSTLDFHLWSDLGVCRPQWDGAGDRMPEMDQAE